MTDTFIWNVSPGTTGTVTHRVRKAQFGDGYAQVVKDGINTRASSWSIAMNNLPEDDALEVTSFLDRNAGRSFHWSPPRSITQGWFICSDYTLTPVEFGLQSISATFEEVFFP